MKDFDVFLTRQPSILKVFHGLDQFIAGVHDKRAIAGDGFVDRRAFAIEQGGTVGACGDIHSAAAAQLRQGRCDDSTVLALIRRAGDLAFIDTEESIPARLLFWPGRLHLDTCPQ